MNTVNLYLSGGNNSLPNQSIGGIVGSMLSSQKYIVATEISGIEILSANNNPIGPQTLSYIRLTGELYWGAKKIQIGSDGIYKIGGETNLFVQITNSYLPLTNTSIIVTIDDNLGNFLRNITHHERTTGLNIYRCGYIFNSYDTAISNVTLEKNSLINFGEIKFTTEYQDLTFDSLSAIDMEKLLVIDKEGKLLIESGFKVRTDNDKFYKDSKLFHGGRHEKIPNSQKSDGNTIDVATHIGTEADIDNILSVFNWTDSITWPEIKSKNFKSFWLRYDLPAGSVGPEIVEKLRLKLNYER